MQHALVAYTQDRFAGWPANNGVWQWERAELLVGFSEGVFVEQPGHNIEGKSDTSPAIRSLLARSRDGGQTWNVEAPQNYVAFHAETCDLTEEIRFDDPNFALRVIGVGYHGTDNPQGGFYLSYDRGKTWNGAYRFGELMQDSALNGWDCTARTDYLLTGARSGLVFLSARPSEGGGGRDKAFCAETNDGGKTFRFLSWIVPLSDPYRAVMPATARLQDGRLVAALRRRNPNNASEPCWIDAYASSDNGVTWEFLSRVGETGQENGNPPALLCLQDGRLCCAYGNRSRAQMLARYSEDGGATWQPEIVLRADFQPDRFHDNDFGYPRLIQNAEGQIVALYYWATREHPEQHIAATLWKP